MQKWFTLLFVPALFKFTAEKQYCTFIHQGWQLKAQAFAAACWHDEQAVLFRECGIHRLSLHGSEAVQFKHISQNCLQLLGPWEICKGNYCL